MSAAEIAHVLDDRVDPLDVFRLRGWARAHLYREGELDLQEAVDELQAAAEREGLIRDLGQDAVQVIMAKAFGTPAEEPEPIDVQPRAAESTVQAIAHSLRTRGVEALERESTRARVAELSRDQLAVLIERMARERTKYPAAKISDELFLILGELLA